MDNSQYTLEDAKKAFEMYYDMKCRNMFGLATLSGYPLEVLQDWSKEFNWPKKLESEDKKRARDTYSRMKRLTIKQTDTLETMLDNCNNGKINDVFRIAKVNMAVNETRNSLLKERQYEDARDMIQDSSKNVELLDKLTALKKDMKALGLTGLSFDSSASILEGEEDGTQS